jgi:alpha-galactosidase
MATIEHDPGNQVWLITTPATSYAVHLTPEGELVNLHWGPVIHLADAVHLVTQQPSRLRWAERGADGAAEYPVEAGLRFGKPTLSVEFGDGVREIEWEFDRDETLTEGNRSELDLHFRDRTYPLRITLSYRAYEKSDVIERWVELRHTGQEGSTEPAQGPMDVRIAHSAAWSIPHRDDYRISHLHGRWAAETQLDRVPLSTESSVVLGSRTGTTSHEANPWFAIDDGTAGEEHGEVWSGALAWSGVWQFVAHRYANGRAQVSGGFGHDGFSTWRLHPGELFETPVFAGLYSAAGFGASSREWHTYQLRHIVPKAGELRPVLYNSWEATWFDINESNQKELAERAADLGVELFVMDDGWFGKRVDDHAGLGDWTPNPERFPQGLKPLADYVHELGMQFGIWVEPEMVNPDSDLYRAHPDWVYHYPTRRRQERRNQLVLNFAREDVVEWAYGWLDSLLAENAIDYVKWDMNRPFSEPGWADEQDNPTRLWIDHVRNLYSLLDRLRQAHPSVAFESCSGGGGRVDFGILQRTDMVWTSDNTDAYDRLTIQNGFTQVYAPRVMSAWVTDSPNFLNRRTYSVRWRFHVAMAGLLGLGGDLTKWSDAELAEARELVAQYKKIRPVIQHGLLYRLREPAAGDLSAVEYVARDGSEVVVIAWLHAQQYGLPKPPIRLRGLDPVSRYRNVETGEVSSGALLQSAGIQTELRGDFDSTLIHLVLDDQTS